MILNGSKEYAGCLFSQSAELSKVIAAGWLNTPAGFLFSLPDSADTLTRPFMVPAPADRLDAGHVLPCSKHPAGKLTREKSSAPDRCTSNV